MTRLTQRLTSNLQKREHIKREWCVANKFLLWQKSGLHTTYCRLELLCLTRVCLITSDHDWLEVYPYRMGSWPIKKNNKTKQSGKIVNRVIVGKIKPATRPWDKKKTTWTVRTTVATSDADFYLGFKLISVICVQPFANLIFLNIL